MKNKLPIYDFSGHTIPTEKVFQSFITNTYRKHGYFLHKLSDQAMGYKPYDCHLSGAEGHFFIELKYMKAHEQNFKKENIRSNQHASMQQLSEYDPESALIGIYFEKFKDYRFYTYNDFMELSNIPYIHITLLREEQ